MHLQVSTIGELLDVSSEALVKRFGESPKAGGGMWVYRIARGIDLDPVADRELAKSRGAGKNFERSRTGLLRDLPSVEAMLRELAAALLPVLEGVDKERLGRVASTLTVTFSGPGTGRGVGSLGAKEGGLCCLCRWHVCLCVSE